MTDTFFISFLFPVLWILLASYALFTIGLIFFWLKIPAQTAPATNSDLYISVIIPVRNEVSNIKNLIHDLSLQTFDLSRFEVLIVDDSSTDGTAELATKISAETSLNLRIITLNDIATTSPKKRAIETAIPLAVGELIVTTDGDCRMGTKWLESFAAVYSAADTKLISGPVTFTTERILTDHLQTVEFASLIGSGASAISAGFPSLCNGANLAYQKSIFEEVNGFEGVRHIASGDDEFLMHKIAARYPDGIHFLKNKEACVQTHPHKAWAMFFRQRKRWASKWKHYQSKTPLVLALYIFSCNLSVLIAVTCFASGILNFSQLLPLLAIKCVPEMLFLGIVLKFLGHQRSILYIPVTQLIYPFYVCFFGLIVQQPSYQWKGRKLV